MSCLEREDCTDEECPGHCPKCSSNQIGGGGGGCNGMFCSACGLNWDNEEPQSVPKHWNYRIMLHLDEDARPIYSLHECYYEQGAADPTSWTKTPVALQAENLEWLKRVVLEAFDKPVIDKRPESLYS